MRPPRQFKRIPVALWMVLSALPVHAVEYELPDGKLKGLAVTSKVRHPGVPQVPTTEEAGLTGFELEAWVAIFAPAGTPPDVVSRLTTSIQQALDLPETKTRAATAGIDLRYLSPANLQALVDRETAFWAKTIQAAKITAD